MSAALLEAMTSDHERSAGAWQIEWVSLPDAFLLTSGALAHARTIAGGLSVDADRMRANLDITHGLIVSEAVMMGLAPHLGRGHAHHLVQDLCIKAIEQHRPLFDVLAETPEITARVGLDELRELCDPARYLGLSGEMGRSGYWRNCGRRNCSRRNCNGGKRRETKPHRKGDATAVALHPPHRADQAIFFSIARTRSKRLP